jgi:hypothetical protein
VREEEVEVDPRLDQHGQAVAADAGGNFGFDGLAGADYWVITQVTWRIATRWRAQGGTLLKRVSVLNDQTLRVVLTR